MNHPAENSPADSGSDLRSVIYDERTLDRDFPVHLPEQVYWMPDSKAVSLHYHHNFEIGICMKGSGIFFIGKKIIPFRAGDISVVYPNEIHIAQSLEHDPSSWIFLTVDMNRLFDADASHTAKLYTELTETQGKVGTIYHGSAQPKLNALLKELITELHDRLPEYRFMARILISMIVLELWRIHGGENNPLAEAPEPHSIEVVLPAISYISQKFSEDVTAEKLAALCHISEVHMRRLFANVVGSSPFEYLYRVRINAACAALTSDVKRSISDIANSVGYTSISSFNRHFKKFTGLSPKEYIASQAAAEPTESAPRQE